MEAQSASVETIKPIKPESGLDASDRLRSNTYRLLAQLLAAPVSADLLSTLSRIDLLPIQDANATVAMAKAWQMLKLSSERTTVDRIDDEYHDLFIGVGRGELVPYGSFYQTGFLMDRPLALLRRDLAGLGIERDPEVHEPEDHVSALCESMSLIIENPDEIPFERQQKFFTDHLSPWMGRFFSDLQQARTAQFYIAVGALGELFIDMETRYLGMSV